MNIMAKSNTPTQLISSNDKSPVSNLNPNIFIKRKITDILPKVLDFNQMLHKKTKPQHDMDIMSFMTKKHKD